MYHLMDMWTGRSYCGRDRATAFNPHTTDLHRVECESCLAFPLTVAEYRKKNLTEWNEMAGGEGLPRLF